MGRGGLVGVFERGNLSRPPNIYHRHKELPIAKERFEGVVYELSEAKRTPQGLHKRCSSWFLWGWGTDCGVRLGQSMVQMV